MPTKCLLITYTKSLWKHWTAFAQRFSLGDEWALGGCLLSGVTGIESLYTWHNVFTYNYSPYLKWKCYFYFWQCLKFWLVLLSILCHMQSSIVCYCLYNVWIVVSWLFICDVEAWLIQIPIFEVKHYIWALILLKVEIVVICQLLLKISVSCINFHIKSPYIVKLLQCYWAERIGPLVDHIIQFSCCVAFGAIQKTSCYSLNISKLATYI